MCYISWDVERINRLAQPRNRGRDSSTPPDEKNSKTSDISVKPEKTKTFQIRQINKVTHLIYQFVISVTLDLDS